MTEHPDSLAAHVGMDEDDGHVIPDPVPRLILTKEWMKRRMAAAIPGAYYDQDDGWVVDELTPRGAAAVCRLFPEALKEAPWVEDMRARLLQDARPFDNATPYNEPMPDSDAPTVTDCMAQQGIKLYDFQRIDLGYQRAMLDEYGAAEIAWERGLGKTIAGLCLIESTGAQRTLVVCPNTAKSPVWEVAFNDFLPTHRALVLPNSKGRREKLLAALPNLDEPLVLILHYEALALIAGKTTKKNAKGKTVTKLGNGWKQYGEWDMVICDEAHRLANPTTQTHKALRKVPCKMRVPETGSLIMNHPQEIYGVLNWMYPERYRNKWRDWNDRFLDYIEGGYGKILIGPKPDKLDEMRREMGAFIVYRRKEDELDLPPKTEQTLRVALHPKQQSVYNQLRDDAIAEIEGEGESETIIGLEPIALLGRLRQVATGLELVSGVACSSKLDLAVEMVRDSGDDPFVIFSWYKAAAEAMRDRLEALDERVALVHGGVNHEERDRLIKRFMAGGYDAPRIFVGTISTLGESVNLQRANQAIFLDRSWNPAQNEQAADRIYRIGQKNPVTVTHLVAQDTVDELKVLPVLNTKEQLRRAILGGS